jgi:hypothetical protein
MSDEDDNASSDKPRGVFDNSRSTREQRIADFLGVAGLTLNTIMQPIRDNPLTESDVVTDAHRELVIDLRASGCSWEGIARFFNITQPKLERLFKWELENGRQLRTVSVTRALSVNAIALGDTSAQIGYLKNQPEEEWGTKHTMHEEEAPPDPENVQQQRKENEAFIAGITAGLSIDTTKFKAAKERTPATVAKDKPKQVVYNGVVKKAKGD